MTLESNTVHEFPTDAQKPAAPLLTPARPFFWSVYREVWENRALYLAPLSVAAVILFASLLYALVGLPSRISKLATYPVARQHEIVAGPYNAIGGSLVFTAFLVAAYFCLEALYGERRDRSILFWKSLPISDRTTVLAKVMIPLVVLPSIVFVIALTTQVALLFGSSIILSMRGVSPEPLWQLAFVQRTIAMLFSMFALAVWHAPIYCWFLLASAWAKRAPVLWATVPVLAIGIFEQITTRTNYFQKVMRSRLIGWYELSFDFKAAGSDPDNPLTLMTPLRFLTTPGLWIGLAFAALFVSLAIRLRRDREPI